MAEGKLVVQKAQKRRHLLLVSLAELLLFVTFILLLLISLSLPIIKSIYLLSVSSSVSSIIPTSAATELRFGVWGYCATGLLNVPSFFRSGGTCSKPRLGYNVDNSILQLIGQPDLLDIALKGLRFVLILHPICAVAAVFTFAFALLSHRHWAAVLSLILAIFTAILTTISAVIDIALVGVAMDKVDDVTQFSFKVSWGNAPWMTLVAAIFLWIAVTLYSIMLCGCCCSMSRKIWVQEDAMMTEKGPRSQY